MNLRGVALLAPLCERLRTGMERSVGTSCREIVT